MNEISIHNSVKEELGRNLEARMQKNGGKINMQDVIKEAKFCIAVNIKISERQMRERFGHESQSVLPSTMEFLLEGIRLALSGFFPNDFNEINFNQIKKEYKELLALKNAKDLINEHYNDLFNDYSSNIL